MNKPLSRGWSYQHRFGIIYVESWGYNYNRLGVEFADEATAKAAAEQLNAEYGLPTYMDSKDSESLIVGLKHRFPQSDIRLTSEAA